MALLSWIVQTKWIFAENNIAALGFWGQSRYFKLLRSPGPGINAKESILPAYIAEPVFVNLFLRSPEIDSQPGEPERQPYLPYRFARLLRLAIPGLHNVYKYGLWAGR